MIGKKTLDDLVVFLDHEDMKQLKLVSPMGGDMKQIEFMDPIEGKYVDFTKDTVNYMSLEIETYKEKRIRTVIAPEQSPSKNNLTVYVDILALAILTIYGIVEHESISLFHNLEMLTHEQQRGYKELKEYLNNANIEK